MYTNDVKIASANNNPFLELAERSRAECGDPRTWTQADYDSDPVQVAYWEGYIRWRDAPRKVEFTLFTKPDAGCLSKRISLKADGSILSDGSECVMSRGVACRAIALDVGDFAEWIGRCGSDQAFALGRLRRDLADEIQMVTKAKRVANPGAIARSSEFLGYRKGAPAYALLDYDIKGMPTEVKGRIKALGGFWPALVSVVPKLEGVARVVRRSTSAGLFRRDTGEALSSSGGLHVYILAKDGADINRFLRALHERCWMAGLGWHMVGAGGQLLERSIVDKMVGAPERLVFEGRPICVEPVEQNQGLRRPRAFEGVAIDTVAACPPLTSVELSNLDQIIARSARALAPASAKAKQKFVAERANDMAARVGITVEAARSTIERQCAGVLLPHVVLPFDDSEFEGCTVGNVLADPQKFEDATLADPIEGVSYGRCKARVYLRSDGTPWIRSFAHGLTTYGLKLDFQAVGAAIEGADPAHGTFKLTTLIADSDLNDDETQEIVATLAERFPNVGKRVIAKQIKDAKERKEAQAKQEQRARRLAERTDPRPRLIVPDANAEWLPVMADLSEVIGSSKAKHPQARDSEGFLASARRAPIPGMHLFSANSANAEQEQPSDTDDSPLPSPEQWTLGRLSETEAAETIERHIEYVTPFESEPVHLPAAFVRHFMRRTGTHDLHVLPTISAVATMPIVLADGTVLALDGLDRERGIDFHIPPEMLAVVPSARDVDDDAVCRAMQFLLGEWLVDISTDFEGKCVLISCALSMIERTLLPERPAFFVVAGRRGCGKTTAISMLIRAVTGEWPAAAAWSLHEEERRKALMAYLMKGATFILWDNIPRSSQLSCPHIERSLTIPVYADRILGVSESASPASTAIHIMTGNNIGAKGDLASRSLFVQLETDRPDPENRAYVHSDPIGWTDRHRGKIIMALYTILIGNPQLKTPQDAPGETRFKTWWRLVGSAVEHAAKLFRPDGVSEVKFKDLFLENEDEDTDALSLAEALEMIVKHWGDGKEKTFTADTVTQYIKTTGYDALALKEFLVGDKEPNKVNVGLALANHIGNPVRGDGNRVLTLRAKRDSKTKTRHHWVVIDGKAAPVDGAGGVADGAADHAEVDGKETRF